MSAVVLVVAAVMAASMPSSTPTQVVGGRDVTGDYSFMASWQVDGVQLCGGTLVAPRWVLTAGHCIFAARQMPGRLTVRVGSPDRTAGGSFADVETMVLHPEFGFGEEPGEAVVLNDIGLVKLGQAVPQRPIGIAWPGPAGTATRILGWGCTHDHSAELPCEPASYPVWLQELDTRVAPDAACTDLTPGKDLCAEAAVAGQACAGDSGGPQIRRVLGKWWVVGITSRPGVRTPTPCPGTFVTFTKVAAYRDWIWRQIAGLGGGPAVAPGGTGAPGGQPGFAP